MQISTDLSVLKSSIVVSLFNEKAEKKVSKFADKETGVARLTKLAEELELDIVNRNGDPVWAEPEPTSETDESEDSDGTRLPDGPEGETAGQLARRLTGADDKEPSDLPDDLKSAPTGLAATLKPRGGKRGPSPEHADDDIIEVLVSENPKRASSASHARFALYKTGMRVSDYLQAAHALQKKQAESYRSDLIWDTDKSFIRVVKKT